MRTSGDFDRDVDYYEILQVHPKAHPEIIKRAYRTLVRELHGHPDLGGSHEQAVLINRAYEILSDPEARAEYDEFRTQFMAQPLRPRPSPTARPTYRPQPGYGYQIVNCPSCGTRNRVPRAATPARARCGHCGAPLVPRPYRRPTVAAKQPPGGRDNHLHLPQSLYNELVGKGQVQLRVDRLPRGEKATCRRCRYVWVAAKSELPPRACPQCGRRDWNSFRAFKCSRCGYEFTTKSLNAWPYLLYPRCPACLAEAWCRSCERHFLRRLGRFLKRLRGE